MGDHITVSYVFEVPGHDPEQHASIDTRRSVQHELGTSVGANMVHQDFQSAQDVLDYQQRARNAVNLYPPDAMTEPTLMVGRTIIDTSGQHQLNTFEKAIFDAAYVQQSNVGLEQGGAGHQFVIGSKNANYLYSLGIDPSFVRSQGQLGEGVTFQQLDPDLDPNRLRQIDDSGRVSDVHLTHVNTDEGFINTYITPEEAPNIVSTLTQYDQGEPAQDPDASQRRAGEGLITAGAGALATGGMITAAHYLGTNALGSAAETMGGIGETTPLLETSGGAMNPVTTAGAGTSETSTLLSESTVSETSSSFNSNPSRPGLRARGRPPTSSQVQQVIEDTSRSGGSTNPLSTAGEIAEGMGTAGGAIGAAGAGAEGAGGAALAVGIGLGITGLGLVVGGIQAVASSRDPTPERPAEPRGVVQDRPQLPNNPEEPDPLDNVPVNEQTANFINNMDRMYREQGYTDVDIRLVHQAEANGIRTAQSNAAMQDNLVDVQEQYLEERTTALAEQGTQEHSGYTADTGGGGAIPDLSRPLIDEVVANEPNRPIGLAPIVYDMPQTSFRTLPDQSIDNPPISIGGQMPQGNTIVDGGGGADLSIVPDESLIPNVRPVPVEPLDPVLEPGAPLDFYNYHTDYRGTGYNYYQFMMLPLAVRRRLLNKWYDSDDDY